MSSRCCPRTTQSRRRCRPTTRSLGPCLPSMRTPLPSRRPVVAAVLLAGGLGAAACRTHRSRTTSPVRRLPSEVLGQSSAIFSPVPLTLLRQKEPDAYRVDKGDVLTVFAEDVLGGRDRIPVQPNLDPHAAKPRHPGLSDHSAGRRHHPDSGRAGDRRARPHAHRSASRDRQGDHRGQEADLARQRRVPSTCSRVGNTACS